MLLCHLCLTININKSKNCPVHKAMKTLTRGMHCISVRSTQWIILPFFASHKFVSSLTLMSPPLFLSIVFFMNKIIIYKHSYMFKYINRYWKLKHQLLTRFWNPEERSQFRKHQSELSPYSSCSRQA